MFIAFLALLHFPDVLALPNVSAIPQRCYKGSGLEPLVFVGSFKSGARGDDVEQQYNVLDPASRIREIPCERVHGNFAVVHYLYGSTLVESWLEKIDTQPRSICMDHSYEAGFKQALRMKLPSTSAKVIYTGMDRSKTDSNRYASFRSYDLCMTFSLAKFLDVHKLAISRSLEEESAKALQEKKDFRFVLLINKSKGWRMWFIARLHEYGILLSTFYTLNEKPHPCSYHSKAYDPRVRKCEDDPLLSNHALQFAKRVDRNVLEDKNLIAGKLMSSEFDTNTMIPRGRVHIILESEPSSVRFNENVCLWTERVTEKTWNAISFGHAFILVGTFLSLDLVKAHGFKTFSPCINETYGTILDEDLKLQAALDEIRRLHALSDVEYNHLYATCLKPRAQFNYDLFHSEEYRRKQVQQRLWAWGIADTPGFELGDFRAKCDDVVLRRNNITLSECRY